ITTVSVEFQSTSARSNRQRNRGYCDMVGGLGLRYRALLAIGATVLMGSLAHGPAKAADLGGDCCADLEDRVAELEATTVRQGNKKVSITLYGQVNKAVLLWDDGHEK